MQLSGIIAFLLLIQYEVAISSRHDERFAQELDLFQNSLVERIYDDISLDPEEDNNEIDELADAILREADRRLTEGKLNKRHHYKDKKSNDVDGRDGGSNLLGDSHKKDNTYKYTNNDAVNQYNTNTRKEKSINVNKREVYDDGDDENRKNENNKQLKNHEKDATIKSKRNTILLHHHDMHDDEVEVSHGDNNQVATIKVDNTPDQQAQLANNPYAGKHLFFEPDANDNKQKNKSKYAALHHSNKSPPPERLVTRKKVKSQLDEISFIAIIVGCCVAGVAGIGLVSFCWYKSRNDTKVSKSGSPNVKSNSLKGSGRKKTSDEEKLTRGAEIFHYLHAKKQMQQMEEPNLKSDHCSINESSDDDEEDEDTVYECPGLAPPGDMKVVNPLFSDTESRYSDPPSLHSTPTPPLEEK